MAEFSGVLEGSGIELASKVETSHQENPGVTSATSTTTQKSIKRKIEHLCGECGNSYLYKSKQGLNCHIQASHLSKHKCPICEKILSSKTNLESHVNDHEKRKPHVCGKCFKEYANKNSLITHSCSKNPKVFECSQCVKRFNSCKLMQQHMLVHSEKSKFECKFCGEAFKQGQSRSRHNIFS